MPKPKGSVIAALLYVISYKKAGECSVIVRCTLFEEGTSFMCIEIKCAANPTD
jgi:hypothetical protein